MTSVNAAACGQVHSSGSLTRPAKPTYADLPDLTFYF
jgi:hypothetical protein